MMPLQTSDSASVRLRILARLFWEFFKISLFVIGGGYAILAVADRVFSGKLGWTKEGELIEELPVLQMVPGLIAGNTAIYVGHKMAGRLGSAVALVAVALPSFAIFLGVTCGIAHLPAGNPWLEGALLGARSALTGILLGTVWKAWRKNVSGVFGLFIAIAATTAIIGFGVNTALVLLTAMLFGIARELKGRVFCSVGAIPLVFLKYGLLSFGGGYVLVPMYMEEFVGPTAPLLQIPAAEFSNVIAMTQMTPGPISINAATFFGYRLGGVCGSMLATACLLLPSWFLLVWVLESLEKWKTNRVVRGLLSGVRPATTGLLIAATYAFAGMSIWHPAAEGVVFSPTGCMLSILSAVAFLCTRLAPAGLIFLCAAIGMALHHLG